MGESPTITLNTRKLMRHVEIKVHVKKDWRVPFGMFLMKLGAKIAGIDTMQVLIKQRSGWRWK